MSYLNTVRMVMSVVIFLLRSILNSYVLKHSANAILRYVRFGKEIVLKMCMSFVMSVCPSVRK